MLVPGAWRAERARGDFTLYTYTYVMPVGVHPAQCPNVAGLALNVLF